MVKVLVKGKFPTMKPAHKAYIDARGEGSNLDRAVRDAISKIFKNDQFKGKRADTILPATFTVTTFTPAVAEDDDDG